MTLSTQSLSELASIADASHHAAVTAAEQSLLHARDAGTALIAAKKLVPHGQWLDWLERNCSVKERQAQNYIRLAENWKALEANPQRAADLSIRRAMELLSDSANSTSQHDETHGKFWPKRYAGQTGTIEWRNFGMITCITLSSAMVRDSSPNWFWLHISRRATERRILPNNEKPIVVDVPGKSVIYTHPLRISDVEKFVFANNAHDTNGFVPAKFTPHGPLVGPPAFAGVSFGSSAKKNEDVAAESDHIASKEELAREGLVYAMGGMCKVNP